MARFGLEHGGIARFWRFPSLVPPKMQGLLRLGTSGPLRGSPTAIFASGFSPCLAYCGERSKPSHRRSSFFTTDAVAPLPLKGPSTKSQGFELNRMIRLSTCPGIGQLCQPFRSTSVCEVPEQVRPRQQTKV